jgi:hypothetical protein
MEKITTVGIDLAKNVFQVHAIDASGAVIVSRAIRVTVTGYGDSAFIGAAMTAHSLDAPEPLAHRSTWPA